MHNCDSPFRKRYVQLARSIIVMLYLLRFLLIITSDITGICFKGMQIKT